MKIIDLINKINNNEEVPKEIKFGNTIFRYNKNMKEYIHDLDNNTAESLLFRVMNTHFISNLLKAKVEVIEETKEIQELHENQIIGYCELDIKENRKKINELVRAVNKLIKEREEK